MVKYKKYRFETKCNTNSALQACVTVSGARGREFRPKQTRLVLFFKNIDLCYADKWDCSEVIEFLLQLVQRHGFYTKSLEWINITGIQICSSISELNARFQRVTPRFLAINTFLRVQNPTENNMERILQSQLEPIIARFRTSANIQYIAKGLIDFFTKV